MIILFCLMSTYFINIEQTVLCFSSLDLSVTVHKTALKKFSLEVETWSCRMLFCSQIRDHYLQLSPTKVLTEIFDKYRLLCNSVEIPANKQERRNFNKFVEAVNNFLQVVTSESFGRTLFHIALCISKTEVDAIHRQFLTEATKPKEVPVTVSKKPPPTKGKIPKLQC